ncbi:hypothetical protein ABIB40_002506 [Pedobacter sp. UYP30]
MRPYPACFIFIELYDLNNIFLTWASLLNFTNISKHKNSSFVSAIMLRARNEFEKIQ